MKKIKNTTTILRWNEFVNATFSSNPLKKTSLLLLAVFLMGWNVSWGQILTFEFSALTGNEPTASSNSNNANLNSSTISRGAGLTASPNGQRFNATSWALSSIASAVSGNNYMEFTITPNSGYQFSVSSIEVNWKRSATGNTAISLRSSVDSYSSDLDAIKAVTDNTSTQSFTWTFAQANTSSAVTYRFYSYAESTAGSGGIGDGTGNDITVNGTVVAVTPTWNGTTSTDWNTAANWTPASVPTSTSNVVIPTGTPNSPTVSTLTVDAAATLLLNANAKLTVTGVLTNNGTITLSSGATLVQGASSTVAGSGTWNVNQAVVGSGTSSSVTGRFYFMGSPVATSTTNVLNPSAANRVWSYSESAAAFTEITGSSTALTVGQGYGTIFGANQTVNFTGGAINNSDITVSGLTKTGTSGTSGFNMVSNPYPSYLDWDAITKTNIEPTIWFQTKDGSNAKVFDIYSTTSGITISNSGTTVNQYIAPMQGYWTRVSTGTGSLAMTNSMRSHQSASSGLKTQATDFPIFVRLNLKSGQRNDQAVIFFDKNAANTKDAFDSEKMSVSGASQLYSVIENTKVAINGLNYTSGTAYSVPLTAVFNSDNEFSIEGTEVHVVSGMVYLEDKLMQTMSNLSNNASYTFMAAAGVVEDRFVLHFQPSNALSIDELTKDKITITADMSGNVSVVLNNLLSTEGVITVIDFAGRVLSTSVITQTSTKLKVTEAAGIYFVRVSNQNNIKTERIIISK